MNNYEFIMQMHEKTKERIKQLDAKLISMEVSDQSKHAIPITRNTLALNVKIKNNIEVFARYNKFVANEVM